MIVAHQKDIAEILTTVRPYERIVVAGCGTCVTLCMSGGEKETVRIADMIRLAAKAEGREVAVSLSNPIRQCDGEFLDLAEAELEGAECILSLGCGAGVQFMAERFPGTVVLPGVNTSFLGANRKLGYWTEMCRGCGDCILEKTGGICPLTRCAKSLFNGPCGGSAGGKCEIDSELDCAWQMIYDRLGRLGRLDRLLEIHGPRDWRPGLYGGPRSLRAPESAVEEQE